MPGCESLSQRVAKSLKQSHPAFQQVKVQEEDGAIILGGMLPSFYLKQIVQTLAFNVEGVKTLDNRIEVVRK